MGEAEGRRSKRGDSNILFEHLPLPSLQDSRLQACRCAHTRIYIRARWRLGNGRFSTGHQIAMAQGGIPWAAAAARKGRK